MCILSNRTRNKNMSVTRIDKCFGGHVTFQIASTVCTICFYCVRP